MILGTVWPQYRTDEDSKWIEKDRDFLTKKRVKNEVFLRFFENTPKKVKKVENRENAQKGGIFLVVVPFLGPKVGVPASILWGGLVNFAEYTK